jgi:hypothetical protein
MGDLFKARMGVVVSMWVEESMDHDVESNRSRVLQTRRCHDLGHTV